MAKLGATLDSAAAVRAIEQVPLGDRLQAVSTYELIAASAARHGDRPAITFLKDATLDETPLVWSHRSVFKRITQLANALGALGLRSTDVTSILLPNLPHYHIAMWGAEAAGIANPINPLLEPQHIIDIMNAAEARALITIGPGIDAQRGVMVRMMRQAVPSLTALIQIEAGDDLPDGIYDFDRLIADQPDDRLTSGRVFQGDDIASYFHTGGTTGAPKLVPHSQRNESFMGWLIGEVGELGPGSTQLTALPMFHVAANGGESLGPLIAGSSVVMATMQGWRGPNVMPNTWKLIERYRIDRMAAVPTVYGALLNVPVDADIGTLRFCGVGAAPLSVELARAWRDKTGVALTEAWGMTESTHMVTCNPRHAPRPGSIGLRLPYTELKIAAAGADGWHDCATDEAGTIFIRGPNVFAGYKNPKNNEGAWLDGGWFNTGDLGRIDADGFVYLSGRAKDLIIRGGHNIDPGAIEEVLYSHPAVALAAAIGQPDAHAGEVPIGYVTLKPGAEATPAALLDFAATRIIERAAMPKRIEILAEMPVTAVGKIFKPALRLRATERVLKESLVAAGLSARIECTIDPKFGLVATVRLDPGAALEAVRQTLGAFTIPLAFV